MARDVEFTLDEASGRPFMGLFSEVFVEGAVEDWPFIGLALEVLDFLDVEA